MMTVSNFAGVILEAPAAESSAAASLFAHDIADVLDGASFVPPAISVLADRAIVNIDIALREAAGRPADDRWHAAYDALKDFIHFYLRCARPGNLAPLARLTTFLAENSDLSHGTFVEPDPLGRAFEQFFERS